MAMCLVLLAAVLGNAATATKLQTARSINGTNFDGSANITTTKWGTSRNIALTGAVSGNANVDGSGNVTITTTQANIATLTGTITTTATTGEETVFNSLKINFPTGFNKDNCVVMSLGLYRGNNIGYAFGHTNITDSRTWLRGGIGAMITFNYQNDGKMTLTVETPFSESYVYNYKIVLMKVS